MSFIQAFLAAVDGDKRRAELVTIDGSLYGNISGGIKSFADPLGDIDAGIDTCFVDLGGKLVHGNGALVRSGSRFPEGDSIWNIGGA